MNVEDEAMIESPSDRTMIAGVIKARVRLMLAPRAMRIGRTGIVSKGWATPRRRIEDDRAARAV